MKNWIKDTLEEIHKEPMSFVTLILFIIFSDHAEIIPEWIQKLAGLCLLGTIAFYLGKRSQ